MSAYSKDRLAAVAVIEGLRSGIPTQAASTALPNPRASSLAPVLADLQSLVAGTVPPGRLAWGEYGQGKSHFLTLIEHEALSRNLAVSRVTLSREISCNDLYSFYHQVASALRVGNSRVPGLRQRLVSKQGADLSLAPWHTADRYVHPRPGIVLDALLRSKAPEDLHLLYQELMGGKMPAPELRRLMLNAEMHTQLPQLKGFRPKDHATAYFGVLADACRFCGSHGLVILIDELELIGRLGKVSRFNAYRNLAWLLGWSQAQAYPIYVVSGVANSLQEFWQREGGRFVADPQSMPSLAVERGLPAAEPLLTQFFHTATDQQHCLRLLPLARPAVISLLSEIVRLHGVAHNWQPPCDAAMVNQLTAGLSDDAKLRQWIRLLLEALDLCLTTGEFPVIQVVQLMDSEINETADDEVTADDESPTPEN